MCNITVASNAADAGGSNKSIASPSSEDAATLYDRLGGEAAVAAAVHEFYLRVLDDEVLAPFFDGVAVPLLKNHQRRFFKIAFTRIPYDLDVVRLIRDKHRRLFDEKGLSEVHFDRVAGHLVATLQHLGVPQNLVDEAAAIVLPLRVAFVGSSS